MALHVTIRSNTYTYTPPVQFNQLSIDYKATMRSSVTMKVIDNGSVANATSGLTLSQGLSEFMQISISVDEIASNTTIWSGYVESLRIDPLPGSPYRLITVAGMDHVWLAQKRWFTGYDFISPNYAGDIVSNLYQNYLSAEGVLCNIAYQNSVGNSVSNPSPVSPSVNFDSWTLSGVQASASGLTLTPSGTDLLETENSAAQFTSGSFSGTTYLSPYYFSKAAVANNQVQLAEEDAIYFSATASHSIVASPYCQVIFANSAYTVQAFDVLVYDMWVSSSSAAINGSVNIQFNDTTYLNDLHILDQWGNDNSPIFANGTGQSLTGFADDRWYHRIVPLTAGIGKSIFRALISLSLGTNLSDGDYRVYIKNVQVWNGATLKTTLFHGTGGTSSISPFTLVNYGFKSLSVKTTKTYTQQGTRVSPGYILGNTHIARSSTFNFDTANYAPTQSFGTLNQIPYTIATSWDNVTYQIVTDTQQPIAGLLPGWNVLSDTISMLVMLNISATLPTQTPALLDQTVQVTSGPNAGAINFLYQEYNNATFSAGTISGTAYGSVQEVWVNPLFNTLSALRINGAYNNWAVADTSNQTTFSTHIPSYPSLGAYSQTYAQNLGCAIQCTSGGDVKSRLDWVGSWADFVLETDIIFGDYAANTHWDQGILYRTTFWGDGDTYGYFAYLRHESDNTLSVGLQRGSNSGSASMTPITSVPGIVLIGNVSYHMRITAHGSTHMIDLDGTNMITVVDGTFTGAGGIGLRFGNVTGLTHNSVFMNLGVQGYSGYSGQRTSPGQTLAANFGTASGSVIQWNEISANTNGPPDTYVTVEATLDGGSTWMTCTNNSPLPQLAANASYNLNSAVLKLRETLTTTNVCNTPYLEGLTVAILQNATASGTAISPALPLTSITDCGATSAYWTANTPFNTKVIVDSSIDNEVSWQNVGNSTGGVDTGVGNAISGLTSDGPVYFDEYLTNTSANYTLVSVANSTLMTFTVDTAIQTAVTMTGGINSLAVWQVSTAPMGPYGQDMVAYGAVQQSDQSGIAIRYVDNNNFYFCAVADGSSTQAANTITVKKCVGGTVSNVAGPYAIDFPRPTGNSTDPWTVHIVKFEIHTNKLSLTWDGTLLANQVADSSIAGASSSKVAYYNQWCNGSSLQGGTSIWHFIRGQQAGMDASSKNVHLRATLSTSNPSAVPVLSSTTASVRTSDISSGLLVPSTSYSYNYTIADCMTDLATRSIGYWRIDPTKKLFFQQFTYPPAPFAINTNDILGGAGTDHPLPQLFNNSPSYRNTEYIKGGNDLISRQDSFTGNGFNRIFSLSTPVGTGVVPTITVNGIAQSTGVTGTTGAQFYYVEQSTQIEQDNSQKPLTSSDKLVVTYEGNTPAFGGATSIASASTFYQKSLDLVNALKVLDGSTGIVEHVTTGPQVALLTTSGCATFAQSQVDMNGIIATSWAFTTTRWGLQVGQQLTVWIPAFQPYDLRFTINEIQVTLEQQKAANGTDVIVPYSRVTVTSGPDLGTWGRIISKLTKASGTFV